jgi:hypothetical protein
MRQVERLEPRRLFASFTAASVTELISDINAANAAGGSNAITLSAGSTFDVNAADNSTDGPNGLPVVVAGDELTIIGNGDAIQRSKTRTTPVFRFFEVAPGGTLSLNNLTLSGGFATYFTIPSEPQVAGGAILSRGTLNLDGVTVQNCTVQATGGYTNLAAGGAIYSSGTLAIANSKIQNNQALGSAGESFYYSFGGLAEGGGVYAGGGASLTNTTVTSNVARGGNGADGYRQKGLGIFAGGRGGDAFGGGVAGGNLTLRGCTVTGNTASGGAGGKSPGGNLPPGVKGAGRGGGIYISSASSAGLDAFTLANTKNNTASTSDNDIFGSYSIL